MSVLDISMSAKLLRHPRQTGQPGTGGYFGLSAYLQIFHEKKRTKKCRMQNDE